VEHPKCPHNENYIRAHTFFSGYFIEKISTEPLETKLIMISQTDIKGMFPLPAQLVKLLLTKGPQEFVKNLTKSCDKLRLEE
jgi:hypothetical protein